MLAAGPECSDNSVDTDSGEQCDDGGAIGAEATSVNTGGSGIIGLEDGTEEAIAVLGNNFSEDTLAVFVTGGVEYEPKNIVYYSSDGSLSVRWDDHTLVDGVYDVKVWNPGSATSTLSNAFKAVYIPTVSYIESDPRLMRQ